MKKSLMLSLVTVLALGVAGIGWAAYPTADEAAAPAVLEDLEIEAAPSALEAFEAENEALAADFEALLDEPTQVAWDCCQADCRAAYNTCKVDCLTQPDPTACRAECDVQFNSCMAGC